jgi:hypothetical protein
MSIGMPACDIPHVPSSAPARRRAVPVFVVGCLLLLVRPAAAQQTPGETPARSTPTFEIAPRGYVQVDWRGYPDWTATPGSGRLNRDTLELRRARVGLDGRWRALSFEVTIDPQDTDGTFVRDAYGQLRLPGALRLRIGQFKIPGALGYMTSARNLDYLERPALADLSSAGRDIGAMLSGRATRVFAYQVGVFAGDGNGRSSRSGVTSAGRLEWTIARRLVLGGAASLGRTDAADGESSAAPLTRSALPAPDDSPNGIVGRSSLGYRFFEGVYVEGWRARTGVDLVWEPGPWRFTGEALRVVDQRHGQGLDLDDLADVAGLGWSASVRREFGRTRGAARTRWREWAAGMRLDRLSFDDVASASAIASVRPRAADIRAQAATTLTMSGSWGPSRWMRVLADAGLERYSDARSAPEPGRDDNYWRFGTRLQVELP